MNITFRLWQFLLFSLLTVSIVRAQTNELYIGAGESVYISAGETLAINGFTMAPSSGFSLTKSVFKQSSLTNSANVAPNSYIPVVYRFEGTTNAFSGVIAVSYAGEETATEASYKIQYYNGTGWTRVAGSTVNTTDDLVTSNSLTGALLNELTISDLITLLPVRWLSFTGIGMGESTLLQWSTASETNSKCFEVQHSLNARSWSTIGVIAAAGNSIVRQQYCFTHTSPAKNSQVNFYRIVQRDRDENSSVSATIQVIVATNQASVLVFPNPAKATLNVYLSEAQEVHLINASGMIIWQKRLPAGLQTISIEALPRGMYLMRGKQHQQRILFQ